MRKITVDRVTLSYLIPFMLLIVIYLLVLFLIPPDASTLTRFDLSTGDARFISLTVAIPIVIIWLVALFGLLGILRYARKIRKDKDGKAFSTIGKGLSILVIGFPVQSIVSSSLNYLGRENTDLIPTYTILVNYFVLGVALTGFYFVYKGTKQLAKTVIPKKPPMNYQLWQAAFIAFVLLFTYLTLNNPARNVPTGGLPKAVYYLPDWLLLFTIIVPYITVWYMGFQSAYYLRLYSKRVPGILYRQAFAYISGGFLAIITGSILQRFLSNMTGLILNNGLRVLLAVLYILLVAISVGYVLLGIGARKLRRIEEV